jgi:hypothetical protein
MHIRVVTCALFAAAMLGFVPTLVAPASAAVYSPRQALPADAIQEFLANPAALLSQFPDGGALMITKVRELAGSDPATLSALIGLLKTADPDQSTAIGTGLGQVALMAINSDQGFATEIQTEIAQAGNTSALTAFSAVVGGDIKLAATGPGIGIGGGGESQTLSTTGLGGFFAGNPFNLGNGIPNRPDTFTTPGYNPGTPGYNPGTPGNNPGTSVSSY